MTPSTASVFAADVRAALESGESAALGRRSCSAATRSLEEIHSRLDGAAQQRLDAEHCLEEARAAMLVGDLRLEREEVLAELAEAAREWKLRVLAAALLEASVQEHEGDGAARAPAGRVAHAGRVDQGSLHRHRPLRAAGRTLPGRSRGAPRGGGRRARRGPCCGQVHLSLLLGRAAQLASRGTSLPFVLDDVLGPLSHDDAHLVAQEIASLARAHPVFYLTTAARRVRHPVGDAERRRRLWTSSREDRSGKSLRGALARADAVALRAALPA